MTDQPKLNSHYVCMQRQHLGLLSDYYWCVGEKPLADDFVALAAQTLNQWSAGIIRLRYLLCERSGGTVADDRLELLLEYSCDERDIAIAHLKKTIAESELDKDKIESLHAAIKCAFEYKIGEKDDR